MDWMKAIEPIIFSLMMLLPPDDSVVQPNPLAAGVAPRIVHLAHRYHGILSSEVDEFGYRYFYRDGKRCRLLTKEFLKKEKNYGTQKGNTKKRR